MTRRPLQDPYLAVLQQFNRLGVRYVVIGMAGINYYATNPAESFASMDFDFFIEPTLRNVEHAIRAVQTLKFMVGTTGGPVEPRRLKQLVHDRTTLTATTPDGLMVELWLRISGYSFAALSKDAKTFTVQGIPVRVGQLSKLLKSKQLADRPKDRQFLRRYRQLLEGS